MKRVVTVTMLLIFSAMSAADMLPLLLSLDGFSAPECVVVDPDTGMAYVSNMATPPETYWMDTGEGFISRLRPDGALDALRWVESTPGFVINQPKGMAIRGGHLYIADNTRILVIGLADGRPIKTIEIPGAERLNDMAADAERVYVSDTATGRIYRVDIDGGDEHVVIGNIEGVNGITVRGDSFFAVSWALHEMYELFPTEERSPVPFGVAAHFTNLDGVEVLPDGRFIVSDFMGNKISSVSADRKRVTTLYELTTPADIGIDLERQRLYVPQLTTDTVVILSLAPQGEVVSLPNTARREYDELLRQMGERSTWDNERLARETFRSEALILDTDRTPVDIVWRRTRALLEHLKGMPDAPVLSQQESALEALEPRVAVAADAPESETREVFAEIVALRRNIALANPLLNFQDIVFIKRHKAIFEHMCDQYYGIAARPGGGLFILENAFSDAPRVRNVLADSVVSRGRLAGHRLRGGTSPPDLSYDGEGRLHETTSPGGGAFLSPDLSFDGRQILFSYVECVGDTRHRYHREDPDLYWSEPWDPGRAYHVFKVDVDGGSLEQLTDGPWNDMHACWLPDGRIAFISERRGGFLRCGRVCPVYTLYQMESDGGMVRPLSYHETHEWLPSVDHNGMIAYTRWDYVDRDSDIAHHIWLKYPDGRDPRAPHGNYPRVRESRPWMEMSIRAIPDSHLYLAVAAPHHGQHFGSIIAIDIRIEDDHEMSQVRRVTPEVMLPESESAPGVPYVPRGVGGRGQVYGTPWPLSEDFYLAVYDPGETHHSLYLVDSFGNRELLYYDPDIACSDPIPLRSRPTPPVIPVQTRYAAREKEQPATGVISVANVYDSLLDWPEDVTLKELRVVQIFPKSTPAPDVPRIGVGDQSFVRGSLGTAPIAEDGSVHFEAPAGITFYFQALDERGLAVQTMRSAAYLHPGERLSCVGCHEQKQQAPGLPERMPEAFRRPPVSLAPESEGAYPVQFSRLVQPVLDKHCVDCHANEIKAPDLSGDAFGDHGWSQAMLSLAPYAWAKHGGNFTGLQRNKTSYSIPGEVGARASELFAMLDAGHQGVELSPEEMRRITLWLDTNSVFYGAYHDIIAQARGEHVTPHLE